MGMTRTVSVWFPCVAPAARAAALSVSDHYFQVAVCALGAGAEPVSAAASVA
jgi:hypothetical protein